MKNLNRFNQTKDGYFICKECNKICKTSSGLSTHVNKKHNLTFKEYFDRWIKYENEDVCKICGNKTKFSRQHWYLNTCSHKCRNELIKIVNIEKSDANQKKRKITCIKKYGVSNPFQSDLIKEKIKRSFEIRYGVNHNMKSKEGYDSYKSSIKRKYGVENIMQLTNIHNKMLKSSFLKKKYSNTNLWYQGSYELDFLEKFLDKIDIENGPSIPYLFEGKNKVYHSDFYISSLNLVVEIKSNYLYKKDYNVIKEKEKYTISCGFNYIIILDKDYSNFNNLLSK